MGGWITLIGILCICLAALYAFWIRGEKFKKNNILLQNRIHEIVSYYDKLVDELFEGARRRKPKKPKRGAWVN